MPGKKKAGKQRAEPKKKKAPPRKPEKAAPKKPTPKVPKKPETKKAVPAVEAIDHYALLNARQQRFVDEYLLDLNGTQAAIRAGYSSKTAHQIAYENLRKPEIAAAIAQRKLARQERLEITQDEILRDLHNVKLADANELVEFRRTCCRYCYGEGHRYQRTQGERERDYEGWLLRCEKAEMMEKKAPPPFDEKGGVGFIRNADPNPACPECCGEGVGEPHFKDTRFLSDAARTLYAGAKLTKDGIEIKMHSRTPVLEMLAKHTKIYDDAPKLNLTLVPAEELDAIHQKALATAKERQKKVLGRMQRMGLKPSSLDDGG